MFSGRNNYSSYMNKPILIKKNNGELEEFNESKLTNSLVKAGASVFIAKDILEAIKKKIINGTETYVIYKEAFDLLRKKEVKSALRYSLKRSITDLGPTGFPFEDYVAEIFKAKGYEVLNDQIVSGKCVDHEIDVIAYNQDELIITEVKFHNQLGIKSDLKVVLYVKSRFDDLSGIMYNYGNKKRKMTKGLLITNTKFTDNAVRYGRCAGLNMIGWNYPLKGNLHDLINETGVHPLTCLSSLTNSQKKEILEKGIVNCRELKNKPEILKTMNINEEKIKNILTEIDHLCVSE